MQISDWINVVLCILSFVLSVISVITVVITLKQNSKMIENSTRPYITIYGRVTNFQDPAYYIVLRNFGQTGAIIEKFECNLDLLKYSYSTERRPFEHIKNTFIAPTQSIISNIDPIELGKDNIEDIIFNITYSSGTKKYIEQYIVNFIAETDNVQSRANTKDKELKIISYTLQDLVEKQL